MNVALRTIKNKHIVLALAPKRLTDGPLWPRDMPPPILVADTEAKARAASLLCGIATRDGRPVYPSDLSPTQAHDVVKHLRSDFPSLPATNEAAIPTVSAGGLFSSES